MLTFTRTSETDFVAFGRRIGAQSRSLDSHERASQRMTEALYHEFGNGRDSELALVRIYRLTHVADLPDDLRKLVEPDEKYVMALTGTYGLLDAWRDRRRSVNHRVIPIRQVAVRSLIPMFEAILINGMGVNLKRLYETGDIEASTDGFAGMFHIPDVSQSPDIPSQAEFVTPYDIKSEVGFGGLIAQGQAAISLYTLFAFSRVPVSSEAARHFFALRPFLGTALATRSDQSIFIGT